MGNNIYKVWDVDPMITSIRLIISTTYLESELLEPLQVKIWIELARLNYQNHTYTHHVYKGKN